jgi:phospholipid/cholesterol/gamma-HCH transport system substrate-binding protein
VTNMNKAGDAAERAGRVMNEVNESLQEMAARVGYETLPRVNSLADDVGSAARSVDRAAETFNRNPRSVLFGAPQPAPGPGEPGFQWPSAPSNPSK